MEKILEKLFDYQHFENNEKLEKLIRKTSDRYTAQLSEDELSLVNAAGDASIIGGSGMEFDIDNNGDIKEFHLYENNVNKEFKQKP